MQLLPGDLVFVRGKGFVSDAIEDITRSLYSHVAGYVGADNLIEAQGLRKTGYQSLDAYKGCADVFRCDLPAYKRVRIVSYADKAIGTRYDYALVAWEFLRYLFKILMPYAETNSYICSTLWSDAYRSVGVDLCPGIKYPSPADLAKSKLLRKVGSL